MFRQMTKEKESWIEKLIELLNEYDNEEFWEALYMENKVYANDFLIISKKFWFIQWLVENEKIDKEKVWENSDFPMVKYEEFLYEWLLMLLSIQDEPINFLISILK